MHYILKKILNNIKSDDIVNKIIDIKKKIYSIYSCTKIQNPENLLDLFKKLKKFLPLKERNYLNNLCSKI